MRKGNGGLPVRFVQVSRHWNVLIPEWLPGMENNSPEQCRAKRDECLALYEKTKCEITRRAYAALARQWELFAEQLEGGRQKM
jgi:hypothetical protein